MKRIIKKLIGRTVNTNSSTFMDFINCSGILLNGFNLDCRFPVEGKKYVEIGKNTMVDATFIFESGDGEVSIGANSFIGRSTFISRTSIEVGEYVFIAWGCYFYDHDSHSVNYLDRRKDIEQQLYDYRNGNNFIASKNWEVVNSRPIIIGNDAWIGMNCIILKGVTIGEGAIISAGSVVTRDVEPWSVYAGNPAVKVKSINR